jgi:hypothetical protein
MRLHAPFNLSLGRREQVSFLTDILAANPVSMSFGIDIWTQDKKVLYARFLVDRIETISFRRGIWENDLLLAAESAGCSVRKLML